MFSDEAVPQVIGDVLRGIIEATVADPGLENIPLQPYSRRSEFSAYLGLEDIGVRTLAVELESLAISNRIYSYLAAGLPLLGIAHANSELAEFADEGLSFHFQSGAIDQFAPCLQGEIGRGSRSTPPRYAASSRHA